MADLDWVDPPYGKKQHLVDMESESMLALGHPNKDDHKSLCGHVPHEWSETGGVDSPCSRCVQMAMRSFRPGDVPGFSGEELTAIVLGGGGG